MPAPEVEGEDDRRPAPSVARAAEARIAEARYREPSSIGWVVSKCLLLGAFIAVGIAAYLAFSPVRNPEVQDCGNSFTFVVLGKADAVVDFGRLDNPESVRKAQQPTCRERTTPRLQEALTAFGAFVALGLLGAIVGLVDDRVAYHRAPRFETLLAERPKEATGRMRPAPQLARSTIGRALPPIDLWDVGWLAVLGVGGAAALVVFAGAGPVGTVLGQVDWRGIAGAALLVAVATFVAGLQLVASSRRRLSMIDAVEMSAASSFLGPVQPALGPLGLDVHALTRLSRNRAHALSDSRVRQILAVVVTVPLTAWVLVQAELGSLPTPQWPRFWYVPLGWCAVLLFVGGARSIDRYRRLAVRPGWRALRDLQAVVRVDPMRVAISLGAAVVLPLVEVSTFVVVAVATHDGVEFGRLAAVWLGARALGVLSPLNRGVGFIEPAATLGLLVIGVPVPYAVVTVLVHRVLTLWLPMIPGARAHRRLRNATKL